MSDTVYQRTFKVSALELKRMFREKEDFESTRKMESGQRLRFFAHANGYVMAQPTNSFPIVVSEDEWRSMPIADAS